MIGPGTKNSHPKARTGVTACVRLPQPGPAVTAGLVQPGPNFAEFWPNFAVMATPGEEHAFRF